MQPIFHSLTRRLYDQVARHRAPLNDDINMAFAHQRLVIAMQAFGVILCMTFVFLLALGHWKSVDSRWFAALGTGEWAAYAVGLPLAFTLLFRSMHGRLNGHIRHAFQPVSDSSRETLWGISSNPLTNVYLSEIDRQKRPLRNFELKILLKLCRVEKPDLSSGLRF